MSSKYLEDEEVKTTEHMSSTLICPFLPFVLGFYVLSVGGFQSRYQEVL